MNYLADIADELAVFVQLMTADDAQADNRPTRGDIAPHHLAEMEAVIDAAFAHLRDRADTSFFTMPLWAEKRYATIRQ